MDKDKPLWNEPEYRINWGLIIILVLNAYYWVNVYWYGFFMPTIVTIILAAVVGLVLRLKGEI